MWLRCCILVDDYDSEAIRCRIYQFYKHKEHVELLDTYKEGNSDSDDLCNAAETVSSDDATLCFL